MKVPLGWKKDKFSNVLEIIKDCTHFSPSKFGGRNLYITSKNIRMGYLDLSNVTYIPDDEHERMMSASPKIILLNMRIIETRKSRSSTKKVSMSLNRI